VRRGLRSHGGAIGFQGSLVVALLLAAVAYSLPTAFSQKRFEAGGFLQAGAQFFARRPNPADTYAIGSTRLQLWSRTSLTRYLSLRGTCDLQIDTHHDIDRDRWSDVSQRGLRIPAGALNELFADVKLGHFDLRVGRQAIRWGRADGFNPTDNLVPYDYLDTFADARLPVNAVKADTYFGGTRVEFAWVPTYTPTRLPLLGQRWFSTLPATAEVPLVPGGPQVTAELQYRDIGGHLPATTLRNSQWGARWNQIVPGAEFSVSFFDGYDDIAFLRPIPGPLSLLPPRPTMQVDLAREYYRVRVAGTDFASQFGPFGIRGEAAYFDQTDPANKDHLLYVVGLDRTWGDWFVIVQYADLYVPGRLVGPILFPDLALRSTVIGRVERTLGPSRSFEIKGALRLRDGDFVLQPSYSVALTNRWRLKLAGTAFGGPKDGYLGQFRDNANVSTELRYSF
jgi:hypothetical protein